jgi:uncharacterized protein (DUF488 family)
MQVYTIGFTQKSAAQFFETLKKHEIKRLIDVRLNNSSQLSGFSKKNDLAYFLQTICGAEYIHMPSLAPTQEMRDEYRKSKNGWETYARKYIYLLREREISKNLDQKLFDVRTVVLCTEPTQEHCHRRLLIEYLDLAWHDVKAIAL